MSIQGADIVSMASLGVLEDYTGSGGGTAPARPLLSVEVTGTTATATIDGEAGAINHLQYQMLQASAWTGAGSRSGDGDIEVADLTEGKLYLFQAYSEIGGVYSQPSELVIAFVSPTGDVIPTGPAAVAMNALKNMLAETAAFQDAVGAAGTDEQKKQIALSYVHLADYKPTDSDFDRPFALICRTSSDRSEMLASNQYYSNGDLEIWFEQEIPEGYRSDDKADQAELYFSNFVGAVVSQAQALSTQPGYLLTRSWNVSDGPARYEDDQVYIIKITVSYGLE